uniref:PEROXIDASE_4 domain-containing protein n=1 Tax=Globodera pallida TaxID=36090 RepID=A0A183BZQ4_GLOPA
MPNLWMPLTLRARKKSTYMPARWSRLSSSTFQQAMAVCNSRLVAGSRGLVDHHHLICYKSKMAKDSGNWKFGGRFRVNNPNKGLADKCAGNDGTKGWHALQVTEEGNGTATLTNLNKNLDHSSVSNGLKHLLDINITKALSAIGQSVGDEFLKALHLGAFMKDYDGMALQIAAMEILRSVGEKDEKLCKKTCAAKWEHPTETTHFHERSLWSCMR